MGEIQIIALDRADFTLARWSWPFAVQRRAEIEAHFAAYRRKVPELWNGRVLLLRDYVLRGRRLHGTFFETDFASFTAWRDWDFPDPAITNCFAAGVIRAADGAFLLGVMSAHTANAGRIYFPCGTPEPQDIVGDTVDLAANVLREVAEETGLTDADLAVEPGWSVVLAGPRLALMRVMRARASADALRARMLAHVAGDPHRELADVYIVRSRSDFHPMMPGFVTAFLDHVLPR